MSKDEPFRTDYEFLKGVDYITVGSNVRIAAIRVARGFVAYQTSREIMKTARGRGRNGGNNHEQRR
jgi:hypothetical protein